MTRVYIVVEGQTEEAFLNEVLAPVLHRKGVRPSACLIGRPGRKGGSVSYARTRNDIVRLLKQDRQAYCSTMIDFYGLGGGFPGTPPPPNIPALQKVIHIEQAMKAAINAEVGEALRPDIRFVPYLQLHEFGALLFSAPTAFAHGIYEPNLSTTFEKIRRAFATPEEIDDDPISAPSKRIIAAHPPYRKPLYGVLGAMAVGVDAMRRECPHFDQWVRQLESITGSSA